MDRNDFHSRSPFKISVEPAIDLIVHLSFIFLVHCCGGNELAICGEKCLPRVIRGGEKQRFTRIGKAKH